MAQLGQTFSSKNWKPGFSSRSQKSKIVFNFFLIIGHWIAILNSGIEYRILSRRTDRILDVGYRISELDINGQMIRWNKRLPIIGYLILISDSSISESDSCLVDQLSNEVSDYPRISRISRIYVQHEKGVFIVFCKAAWVGVIIAESSAKRQPRASNDQRYPLPSGNLKCAQQGKGCCWPLLAMGTDVGRSTSGTSRDVPIFVQFHKKNSFFFYRK